jgi:hypothetical protein
MYSGDESHFVLSLLLRSMYEGSELSKEDTTFRACNPSVWLNHKEKLLASLELQGCFSRAGWGAKVNKRLTVLNTFVSEQSLNLARIIPEFQCHICVNNLVIKPQLRTNCKSTIAFCSGTIEQRREAQGQ